MRLMELVGQALPEGQTSWFRFGDAEVLLQQQLRWFPGRRLTALGQWQGRRVVVKAFADSEKGRAEFRRERAALDELAARGVPAPACLQAVQTDEGGLLLMEFLEGETVEQRLAVLPARAPRRELILDLVDCVTSWYGAGVRQTDIHPGNFLQHNGRWHLLDAASCRLGTVSRKAALKNMAMLLAQFDPLDVPAREKLIRVSPLIPDDSDLRRARARRYRHVMKKTLRECTEFVPVNIGRLRGMARRDAWSALAPLLDGDGRGLNQAMASASMLKDGNSATVVALPEPAWVVKRYNLKNRMHGLRRQFGRTRAKNAWLAGYFLRLVGVPTPRPVAYIEERSGPFVGRCWLLNERLEGEGLERQDPGRELPEGVLRGIGELFFLMRRFRLSHGDLKASNLMVGGGVLNVIDLDAMRCHRSEKGMRLAVARDRRRLLRNWPEASLLRSRIDAVSAIKDEA